MARPALTTEDIASFRARLAAAAYRAFMRRGEAGVTLRAVAADLSVSAMTPYRYVADKNELLALARFQAFREFAVSQEGAVALRSAPLARLARLCRAYVTFALADGARYRLLFSSTGPVTACPELALEAARSFRPQLDATKAAVSAGLLHGDPVVLAHLNWATVHGIVSLDLHGTLMPDMSVERLCQQWLAGLGARGKGHAGWNTVQARAAR